MSLDRWSLKNDFVCGMLERRSYGFEIGMCGALTAIGKDLGILVLDSGASDVLGVKIFGVIILGGKFLGVKILGWSGFVVIDFGGLEHLCLRKTSCDPKVSLHSLQAIIG